MDFRHINVDVFLCWECIKDVDESGCICMLRVYLRCGMLFGSDVLVRW